MAKRANGWICDGCGGFAAYEPWNCPGCKMEVCEECFWMFAHCKTCCDGKEPEEVRLAANAAGFEFEP